MKMTAGDDRTMNLAVPIQFILLNCKYSIGMGAHYVYRRNLTVLQRISIRQKHHKRPRQRVPWNLKICLPASYSKVWLANNSSGGRSLRVAMSNKYLNLSYQVLPWLCITQKLPGHWNFSKWKKCVTVAYNSWLPVTTCKSPMRKNRVNDPSGIFCASRRRCAARSLPGTLRPSRSHTAHIIHGYFGLL